MKKRSILKALLLVLLSCLLAVALVACGGKHTVTYVYTGVDANADGQDDTVTVEVSDGAKLEKPADPTRDGYTFAGWSDGTGIWDFQTDTVTGDITLTARWSAGGDPSTGELDSSVHVYFDLQGNIENGTPSEGEVPTSQTVATGAEITLPAAPAAASGYTFAGWLVDGETELRAAGSKYTVSATVTIRAQWTTLTKVTAKWDAEGVFDFDGEAITLTVNKDLVGTYQPTEEQGGGDTVTFTVKKEELQAAADALTAALKAGEFPTTAVPGAFHVTQKEPTCTEDGKAAVVYTANAVSGSFYAQDAIEAYAEDIPAHGHNYQWNYPADIGDTLVDGESADITGVCSNCGDQQTVTLPAIDTAPESTNAFFDPAGTWPEVFPKKAESAIGVGEYFITGFQTPGCETEGFVSGKYKASETLWVEFDNITFSPLGHHFPSSAEWDSDNHCYVAACVNRCGAQYTLSVVFEKGENGEGTVSASATAVFNKDTEEFTITLPQNTFTNSQGYEFAGWSIDGKTYAPGQTYTAAAESTVTVTATWSATHVHVYGDPVYQNGKVVKTCTSSNCTDEDGKKTVEYDITGISVDSGVFTELVVTDTAVNTTITLPEAVVINARGDEETGWGSASVAIPHGELTATITDNTYKNATITIKLNDSVSTKIDGVTLYTEVTVGSLTSTTKELGTFTGEFIVKVDAESITAGEADWNSWVIQFESNGLQARFRADNYLEGNFGRTPGQYEYGTDPTGLTYAAEGFTISEAEDDRAAALSQKLRGWETPSFEIVRSYNTESKVYEIKVVISQGSESVTLTLAEPNTTDNAMKVTLEANASTVVYSNARVADEKYVVTESKLSVADVTVANGTALDDINFVVYALDGQREIGRKLEKGTDYTVTGDSYKADVANTYDVTITRVDNATLTATVKVTVKEATTLPEALGSYTLTETAEGVEFIGHNFAPSAEGTVFADNDRHQSIRIAESLYEGKVANGITLNVWAKPISTGENWEALFSIYDDGISASDATKYQHFRIGITGLDFGFNRNGTSFSGGGFDNSADKGGIVGTAGDWTMYTVTIDSTAVKVYVNGTLQREYKDGAVAWGEDGANWSPAKVLEMLNTYSNGIRLGSYWPPADLENGEELANFAGTMRNASVYAAVLSADQIAELQNTSTPAE